MTDKNEPAFPVPDEFVWTGMSLRDWFAGQALAGDFAAQNELVGQWGSAADGPALAERAALFYRFADIMLAERSK